MNAKLMPCDISGWAGEITTLVKFVLGLLQLGLSVAMILLVRYQLQGMGTSLVGGALATGHQCWLAAPNDWLGACTYADVVACISMLLTFLTSVLQLYLTAVNHRLRSTQLHNTPRNKCTKRVWWGQQLLLAFGVLWWAAAAVVLQLYISRADAAGLPRGPQRTGVAVCCWLSVVLLAGSVASDWVPRCRPAAAPAAAHIPLGFPTSFTAPATAAGPGAPQLAGPGLQHQPPPLQPQHTPAVPALQSAPQLLVPAPPAALVMGFPVAPGATAASPHQQPALPPVPRTGSAPAATTPLAAGMGPAQLQMTLLELGRLPGQAPGSGPLLPPLQQQPARPRPATWVVGQRAVPGQPPLRPASSPSSARGAVMRVAVVEAPALPADPPLQQQQQQQQPQPRPRPPQLQPWDSARSA